MKLQTIIFFGINAAQQDEETQEILVFDGESGGIVAQVGDSHWPSRAYLVQTGGYQWLGDNLSTNDAVAKVMDREGCRFCQGMPGYPCEDHEATR